MSDFDEYVAERLKTRNFRLNMMPLNLNMQSFRR